ELALVKDIEKVRDRSCVGLDVVVAEPDGVVLEDPRGLVKEAVEPWILEAELVVKVVCPFAPPIRVLRVGGDEQLEVLATQGGKPGGMLRVIAGAGNG